MHADCHKHHVFCEKKKPQKPYPLWHPLKLVLGFNMHRVLEIILDGITAFLSIPYVVHRVLERNPNIKVDFNESEKTVALESVIAWENWAEFGSTGAILIAEIWM